MSHRIIQLATAIIFIVFPIGYLIEILFVLPTFQPILSDGYCWRVAIVTMFGIQFYLNLYKMIVVGANGLQTPLLPALMRAGFRYCYRCQLNAPPRSFHCAICDRCMLRRDHHCSFGAVCVGHFNQRFFIVGAINLWIAVSIILT